MGGWGVKGDEKKKFRCIPHRRIGYQLPTRNVNITYYKHVLIKNENKFSSIKENLGKEMRYPEEMMKFCPVIQLTPKVIRDFSGTHDKGTHVTELVQKNH